MGIEVKAAQSKVSMEEAEKIAYCNMYDDDEKEVIKQSPKIASKSTEIPKSPSPKKVESLKIITAKIPERKGLKIVKKRFDDIEIDIPKIKSLLPIKDIYNQRKVILIYTQEKDFLNLTLVEHHNNEFIIIDNIFKDNSGLNEITTIINEFIYDEIEDEFTLNMHNVKDSHLNDIFFEDNKLKIAIASLEVINILKDEKKAVIVIEDLVLENDSSVNLSLEITKNEFEDEIIDFRKNLLDVIKTILVNNNYIANNIDYIIGNEEALNILSINTSLTLTFGQDIYKSKGSIIFNNFNKKIADIAIITTKKDKPIKNTYVPIISINNNIGCLKGMKNSEVKKLTGLSVTEIIKYLLIKNLITVENKRNYYFVDSELDNNLLLHIIEYNQNKTYWKGSAIDFLQNLIVDCWKVLKIKIRTTYVEPINLPFLKEKKYLIKVLELHRKCFMLIDTELGLFLTKILVNQNNININRSYIMTMHDKNTTLIQQ